jgi:hypothetical protein
MCLSYFFKISFTVSKGCIMQLTTSNTALLTLILLTIYYYIFTVENYQMYNPLLYIYCSALGKKKGYYTPKIMGPHQMFKHF